jgi:hypothetical protein
MIVHRDGPTVRLYGRNGYDWTARLAGIAAAAELIKAKSFTIDAWRATVFMLVVAPSFLGGKPAALPTAPAIGRTSRSRPTDRAPGIHCPWLGNGNDAGTIFARGDDGPDRPASGRNDKRPLLVGPQDAVVRRDERALRQPVGDHRQHRHVVVAVLRVLADVVEHRDLCPSRCVGVFDVKPDIPAKVGVEAVAASNIALSFGEDCAAIARRRCSLFDSDDVVDVAD